MSIIEIKIENKPVRKSRTEYASFPFSKMRPGQSFTVDPKQVDIMSLRAAASQYARYHAGTKFSVVREGPDVFRCGRTK